jgi:transposase
MHHHQNLIDIKFFVKLGKNGSKIREILVQVYGNNVMKKTAVYKWLTRFSEGRAIVTDKERSGRPATSRTLFIYWSTIDPLKIQHGCGYHHKIIIHLQ